MRIVIDHQRCQANGVCAGYAPEVFEVQDDGILHVLVEEPDDHLHRSVREAVRRCPTRAITTTA